MGVLKAWQLLCSLFLTALIFQINTELSAFSPVHYEIGEQEVENVVISGPATNVSLSAGEGPPDPPSSTRPQLNVLL